MIILDGERERGRRIQTERKERARRRKIEK